MKQANRQRIVPLRMRSAGSAVFLFLACVLVCYAGQSQPNKINVPDTAFTMDQVVKYSDSSDLTDPVAELQKRIKSGALILEHDPVLGYLPAILKALSVPVTSQTLVYSKTSSQFENTSPRTPRALYFNDNVYVGFALGHANLDLIAIDKNKGAIFYTLDQFSAPTPQFVRNEECFNCHFGPKTLDVPGLFINSVTTKDDGSIVGQVTPFVPGHNSPLEMRWGGWYVTGTHGKSKHLGNTFLGRVHDFKKLDLEETSNITDLSRFIEAGVYPSAHSDTVALLVLDHVTRMQNYITQANFEAKMAIDDRAQIKAKGLDPSRDWSEKRISLAGEAMVAYMLFRDEGRFEGPIKGTTSFADDFAKLGPFDSQGRSLRQFDLNTRVFKYPCSYMIYSESFNGLPEEMKQFVWKRFVQILTGQDRTRLYADMSDADRKNVLDILIETKPEFRDYFVKNMAGMR